MDRDDSKKFIRLEALAGLILLGTLAIALLIANSPLEYNYSQIIDAPISFGIGNYKISKPLILWVNEGLMAIFFMVLALEIKREIFEGNLKKLSQITLPVACAIGGIVIPILIYIFLNIHDPIKMRGWPIATTTDIAFVLGIIALLGKRVPNETKVLLIALSIIDDIIAVIIIAAYYTDTLSWLSLILSFCGLLALIIANIFNVKNIAVYACIGLLIWFFVVKSGIHATLAGIAIGLAIPIQAGPNEISPAKSLERSLHPVVAFFVIPLFVFVNGGVPFTNFSFHNLLHTVPLGIALGLFIGKTLGVFLFGWLAIKFRMSNLPPNSNYRHLLALGFLSGIGFTMSLFFSALAFTGTAFDNIARQGILLGSLLTCLAGIFLFSIGNKKQPIN